MKTTNTKRILILLFAVVIAVFSASCNNTPQEGQPTATMAPENGNDATQDPNSSATAEPTATPDPLAGLRYWEIDPDKKIYNILLLGLDALEGTMYARNDTTMILQINLDTNIMKLVSFMRDMYVSIPGQSKKMRINNAHYYGGPDLAVDTMEALFDVEIDFCAVVDFVSFTQVMRVVGPIVIDVKEYEVEHLKIAESAVSIEGEMIGGQGVVQYEGTYEFNEYLALSYARDRHSSGDNNERAGDYGRNERQREVIKAAWERVKSLPLSAIPPGVFGALTYVETTIDPSKEAALVITLMQKMVKAGATIEDLALPERRWSLWVSDDGTKEYTNDEFEALYAEEKAAYENEGSSNPTPTGGETPDPSVTTKPAFPDYESWRNSKGYSNVIDFAENGTRAKLHEFLGID